MAIKETQEMLKQWGMWMRGGNGLGYGNVLGNLRGGGLPTAPISDDHALAIDRVIAVLKKTNVEQYRCIKLSYVQCLSNNAIAREVGVSRMTVQRRIESAEHWLDLAFDIEKVSAPC